jgi:crotonobetainyl-CoA:carnitine CoA-transferase CaiB-like acyl-CoA transferase
LTERSVEEAKAVPPGPLAGVRILDVTSVMMGLYATIILGDYDGWML